MKHPPLAILGYSEAAMFLRGAAAPNVGAIVSIHGPRELGVEASVAHRLDLSFDDVEVADTNDAMATHRAMSRRRWAEQNGLAEIAPTQAHAAAIVEFSRSIREIDGIVLCHCAGGMSRSPAAALICLTVWRGEGTEAQCAMEVRAIRPATVPHIGLIRLADDLLGREGRLVAAGAALMAQ